MLVIQWSSEVERLDLCKSQIDKVDGKLINELFLTFFSDKIIDRFRFSGCHCERIFHVAVSKE